MNRINNQILFSSIKRLSYHLSAKLSFAVAKRQVVGLSNRLRRIALPAVLLIIYIFSLISVSYAAFDELYIGARPQGLGGAFTAVADDANTLFYNPAGAAFLRRPDFTSNYARLFMGLSDNSNIGSSFVAYAHPTENYGTPGISWYDLSLTNLYEETAIGLSYAYPISEKLGIGATAKSLSRTFGSDLYTNNAINQMGNTYLGSNGYTGDPVFEKGSKSSVITGDLGLLYNYSNNVTIGFSAQNITQPNIGLASTDKIAAVYRGGVAYKGSDYLFTFETLSTDSDLNFMAGGEKWFSGRTIAIRGGLTLGSRQLSMLSVGATARFDNFSFDYTLLWPLSGVSNTMGTSKIALNIKFGKIRLTKEEIQKAKQAVLDAEKLKKETEEIKQKSAEKQQSAEKSEEEANKLLKMWADQQDELERTKKKNELEKSFQDSMLDYQKRVSQGAEIPERLLFLDKVAKKYENSGIVLTDLYKERDEVITIQQAAKSDYNSSMDYYKQIKARGASTDEMKSLLIRIIEKYNGKGISITEAENELAGMK